MRRITFGQRVRYWFDNTMAAGTWALIGWLVVLTLVIIIIGSLFILIAAPTTDEGEGRTFFGLIWSGILHMLDPGTDSLEAGNVGFILPMLGMTLGGIFVASILIGILTSGIEGKLDDLRKGHSFVAEANHTLILGWSRTIFTVISELIIANASRGRSCIVILADKDKVEMEEEIRVKLGNTGKTRIICRSGSPIDLDDLAIVNPQDARAIVALSPDDEEPDSQVIKTILAITNNPRRRPEPYHIVAEIRNAKNLEAAHLVGGKEAEFVDVDDTISRLIAQTCRQTGLSLVYVELLNFEGDEIYFQDEPALVGKTFAEALPAYEKCMVIGLHFKDGRVVVNPPMDTRIAAGDRVIVIAQDDDKVQLSGRTDLAVNRAAIQAPRMGQAAPERTLILGWNHRAPKIINILDNYVAPGSLVTVMADLPEVAETLAAECANLRNSTVTFQQGDTTDRRTLDTLDVRSYDHVIVLCYSDLLEAQRADARTLITLLHLRDIAVRVGDRFSIVSEMLDDRNRTLAEVTKADDFIVSDKLISLLLAQISENKHLTAVFADIFDAEGAEIYVKPAEAYVQLGQEVNFYTVVEAARQRGHIALGYIVKAEGGNPDRAYGVVLNPAKSEGVRFAEGDRIVVFSED